MSAKVKDFAIPMDEFHPRPSTAAAYADRKANDVTIDHLTAELKKIDAKIELAPDESAHLVLERVRIEKLLVQTRLDREATEERIKEARVK